MFEEDIEDFVLSRLESLESIKSNWNEYEETINKASNNSKQILEILKEKTDLFFNYEECCSKIALYEQIESYKKGFEDSFNIFFRLIKGEK